MTDRELDERLLALSGLADRLCLPGHRVGADRVLEHQEELRNGIRRLYRDRTGAYPGQADRRPPPDRRSQRDPIRVWRA